MTEFTIRKSNNKLLVTLPESKIDTSTTSVALIGDKAATFGLYYNRNLIRMLENFSNTTPPTSPLTGQLWFDSAAERLKIYKNNEWILVDSEEIDQTNVSITGGSINGVTIGATDAQPGTFTDVVLNTINGRNYNTDANAIDALDTMSTQDASSVAITGGTVDNVTIGGSTPAAGTFTTATATTVVTDTINEDTTNAGITIDGVLLKDNIVIANNLTSQSTNGGKIEVKTIDESVSTSSGSTVDTSASFPAGCVILGASIEVTTTITGATTFDVGIPGNTNAFGDDLALTSGTTNIGPAVIANTSSNVIRLTANGSDFTGGEVRVTFHYIQLTNAS